MGFLGPTVGVLQDFTVGLSRSSWVPHAGFLLYAVLLSCSLISGYCSRCAWERIMWVASLKRIYLSAVEDDTRRKFIRCVSYILPIYNNDSSVGADLTKFFQGV